jgi:hypothetical protein
MRPDKQNRRGCIIFSVFLAAIAALILWAALGGVSSESTADDPQQGVNAPAAPPKL